MHRFRRRERTKEWRWEGERCRGNAGVRPVGYDPGFLPVGAMVPTADVQLLRGWVQMSQFMTDRMRHNLLQRLLQVFAQGAAHAD